MKNKLELPKQHRKNNLKQKNPLANSSSAVRWEWIALIGLSAFTFIIFFPSLKCGFTNWDDGTYVTENPMIWRLNIISLKEIFSTPISLNYHPITMLSLAIDYSFSKLNPFNYHLNNVLIHILNSLLVFIFIRSLINRINKKFSSHDFRPSSFNVAFITAALFAIHPMRVESVTWVAERKDVLYVFFFLLSLISYLRWLDNRKTIQMVGCFMFFILSCFSKGMAVVEPVVLVLIDLLCENTYTIKYLSRSIIRKTHFFVASLFFGIVAFKIQSQGAIAAMETFSLFQRTTFGCYGFIMYIWKLFVPLNLSAFYPYPFTDALGNIPAIYYASPFIVLFIMLVMFFALWKNKNFGIFLFFGLVFYFVTVVLVLQFISVGSVIMADRYSYLSYVGLFFAIGCSYEYCKKYFSFSIGTIFLIIILASGVWFSYLTYERTKVWTNAKTLWTDAMKQYPFIEIAYENRGIYFKDHGQLDSMLLDYEFVTQKLHTKNEKIWSNLGNLYGLLGQQKGASYFEKSLNAYSNAILLNPNNASTFLNRAITFSMMGQYAKSLPDFDKSIKLSPEIALTYKNRAYTLMQLGQYEQSISDYDNAIRLYSYDTLSLLNRGISKFNAKKYSESLEDFKKYISLAPNNPNAYYNASIAAKNINMFNESLEYAQKAITLKYPVSQQYIDELKNKLK